MCGILGYYGTNINKVSKSLFDSALSKSKFRGPDYSASNEINFKISNEEFKDNKYLEDNDFLSFLTIIEIFI